jgi:hypothetical protein
MFPPHVGYARATFPVQTFDTGSGEMHRLVLATVVILVAAVAPAHAQFDDTLWGITGTVTPRWISPVAVAPVFGATDSSANYFALEGSDMSVGFARGRTYGSEWGVSFVRMSLKDGSFVKRDNGDTYTSQGNTVLGGQIHKFYSFGTIARRVQIGMNLGIGAGVLRGQMQLRRAEGQLIPVEAKEFLRVADQTIPVFPLVKVEFAVAAILAPGLKARVNAGVNFPGYQKFSITGTYLFGAR